MDATDLKEAWLTGATACLKSGAVAGRSYPHPRQGAEERRSSDHEFLIAKFILKLKKVGKTTIPFWYNLSQIPYGYTVEVRNRFKGLNLIDRVPDELWTELYNIV